jgi:hypothetical protein
MSVVSVMCCQVELITRPEGPTDCGASLCVIKKPRERGGHIPHWAAEPEIIIIMDLLILYSLKIR